MLETLDLPLIWAAILVSAVFLYVLLDGFDLGVGILFPLASSEAHRDQMMASVAPVWDGNETWLVLGGAGLFAVFPKAYAVMMPALYMPIGFMLTALIFRGVAFEFRPRSASAAARHFWGLAFHWGSLVAAFSQGLVLGALIQGVKMENGIYAGGMFDWLTPFSFLVGWGVVWGYTQLGASWLIIKTEHRLQDWSRRAALAAGLMVALMLVLTAGWMLVFDVPAGIGLIEAAVQRSGLAPYLALVGLLLLCLLGFFMSLYKGPDPAPYLFVVGIFLLGYAGLMMSLWPFLVPYGLDFREAAAAPESQAFLLAGAVILLPLILGYTLFVYRTFRGKVKEGDVYH